MTCVMLTGFAFSGIEFGQAAVARFQILPPYERECGIGRGKNGSQLALGSWRSPLFTDRRRSDGRLSRAPGWQQFHPERPPLAGMPPWISVPWWLGPPRTLTDTITNASAASVTISSAAASSARLPDYRSFLSPDSGPGQSASLTVAFTPHASGQPSAKVAIMSDAANSNEIDLMVGGKGGELRANWSRTPLRFVWPRSRRSKPGAELPL